MTDTNNCPDPECAGGDDCSPILSAADVHPRCDICGKAQQPRDDWNGETGNHRFCEARENEEDGDL